MAATSQSTTPLMAECLRKIATGPTMSKDLSFAEAKAAMTAILTGVADPVQAGVFLVALRMKRETDTENAALLAALLEAADRVVADVPAVVDLAEPYDGFARHLPHTSFVPAVLAACDCPALVHGCPPLAPKFGVGHRQILAAAGRAVDDSTAAAARRLADPAIGWAYLDQTRYAPAVAALADLRERIVKRPALSTLEKILGPVRGRDRTHLVVGYVHRGYDERLIDLASTAGFTSALVLRGVEGGVAPSLSRDSAYRRTCGGAATAGEVSPAAAGILREHRAAALPDDVQRDGEPDTAALAAAAAAAGRAALAGAPGPLRDGLLLTAGTVLWHVGRAPTVSAGLSLAAAALDDGTALARFEAT
jgi:anthranilate phosphoribosyltransferase